MRWYHKLCLNYVVIQENHSYPLRLCGQETALCCLKLGIKYQHVMQDDVKTFLYGSVGLMKVLTNADDSLIGKKKDRAPSKSATVNWLTAQTLCIREQEEPHPLTPNYHFPPACCCLFTNPGTKQDVTSSARWIILMWWLCHSDVTKQWASITTPSAQRFPGGIRLTAQETLMSANSFFLIRPSKNVLPLVIVIQHQCGLVNTGL